MTLPIDPDVDQTPGGDAPPVHLRASSLALVFAGGTVGTASREALSLAFPPIGGIPYAIFGINILGALLLGILVEALAIGGPDHGGRRRLRLLLGTGFMGGFTTYSALAADSAILVRDGTATVGVGYAFATVIVGAAATWCGIAVAAAVRRPARKKA